MIQKAPSSFEAHIIILTHMIRIKPSPIIILIIRAKTLILIHKPKVKLFLSHIGKITEYCIVHIALPSHCNSFPKGEHVKTGLLQYSLEWSLCKDDTCKLKNSPIIFFFLFKSLLLFFFYVFIYILFLFFILLPFDTVLNLQFIRAQIIRYKLRGGVCGGGGSTAAAAARNR